MTKVYNCFSLKLPHDYYAFKTWQLFYGYVLWLYFMIFSHKCDCKKTYVSELWQILAHNICMTC